MRIIDHIENKIHIQLFRERLSEKEHATIPKGIVGVLSALFFKIFERMSREATDICLRVLKESNNRVGSTATVRNKVFIISHITFQDCRVHIFSTTFLEIAVYCSIKQQY